VYTRVLSGGELRSRKGVNFPGIDLGIGAFTRKDAEFLKFAAKKNLDAISQSFVQNAEDVEAVRKAARELDYEPFIIAKIERARALSNLDEILASTDGVMVARGDLGVEVPFQEIAIIQKDMIHKANLAGKPVITATHMLESMIEHTRPTRAEVTDVANAIIDGSDCVMLSGETSVGQYPVESVAAMASIAGFTEGKIRCGNLNEELEMSKSEGKLKPEDHISLGVYLTVDALKPAVIFAVTTTGSTARRLARFRPSQWVVAISQSEKTCQELVFSWGVYPVFEPERIERWSCYVADWMDRNGFDQGLALLTEGADTKKKRDTTLIEIIDLS
jgi:pyruvate kinase